MKKWWTAVQRPIMKIKKLKEIISKKESQLESIKTESLALQMKLNKAEKEALDHFAATKGIESKLTTKITEASKTKKTLEKKIFAFEKRIDKLEASKNDLKIDKENFVMIILFKSLLKENID